MATMGILSRNCPIIAKSGDPKVISDSDIHDFQPTPLLLFSSPCVPDKCCLLILEPTWAILFPAFTLLFSSSCTPMHFLRELPDTAASSRPAPPCPALLSWAVLCSGDLPAYRCVFLGVCFASPSEPEEVRGSWCIHAFSPSLMHSVHCLLCVGPCASWC